MTLTKISVIMAVYNAEQTLPQAIDSILAQTCQDWELVICDDCSTDGTPAVIERYRGENPDRIVCVRNEVNSKLPYSLNHCLQVARGEYIARMDADDISLPDRLEKQAAYLDAHPEIAVVGTSMIRFDESGEYGKIKSISKPTKYDLKFDVPHYHATIMMRKSVYDAVGGYTVCKRTERGQDVDLWFKVYAQGYSGANLPDYLYQVREDRAAIRRRKLKYELYFVQTRLIGYKMLNMPFYWKIFALKPVISHFIPQRLKVKRRNRIAEKEEREECQS